jgi:excisionase family DNA binding protein
LYFSMRTVTSTQRKLQHHKITETQAARLLCLSLKTLRRHAGEGSIPHITLGRSRLFSREDLEPIILQLKRFTVTDKEVRERYGVNNRQLTRMVAAGRLARYRLGKGRYRYDELQVAQVARELRRLSTAEVASILRVSAETVWHLGDANLLPYATTAGGGKRAGQRRYDPSQVALLMGGWTWPSGRRGGRR